MGKVFYLHNLLRGKKLTLYR